MGSSASLLRAVTGLRAGLRSWLVPAALAAVTSGAVVARIARLAASCG